MLHFQNRDVNGHRDLDQKYVLNITGSFSHSLP